MLEIRPYHVSQRHVRLFVARHHVACLLILLGNIRPPG
jgi:hypothetical protein